MVGGVDGAVGVYSLPEKRVLTTLKIGGTVTDAVWAGGKAVVASSTGLVKIFEGDAELAAFNSHAGEATALAVHPTGDIVASVGADKSYVLYDLATNSVITQVFSDACKYDLRYYRFQRITKRILLSFALCEIPSRRPPGCRRRRRRANKDLRRQDRRGCCELHPVRPSHEPFLLREWYFPGCSGRELHCNLGMGSAPFVANQGAGDGQ